MNCKQACRLFGAYWEDELTQAERECLEAHFAGCPECRGSYDEMARTLELVGSLPRAEVRAGFAERVVARARRAAAEPDRIPAAAPRWIPITATAALLAVLGAMVFQWAGMPLAPARRDGTTDVPIAVREPVRQPVLVPGSTTGTGPSGSSPDVTAGAMAEIPDSLFNHSEDVEFILDPVTLRKGRAHTVVRGPQDAPRAQQAVITF